tara:strand:- start:280 stop:948 length:669 start_codon:yes stop_codon:yes gene_type:complete
MGLFYFMAKDPAFLFYPNDYIGGTMGMTFEEKGAYIEILMLQFNRGHMTSHMIGQLVGQLWDSIKCKFVQDEQGLWYNIRLDQEKDKRMSFTQSRRNNIKGLNQHTIGHMTSHMEDENEDVNRNINKVKIIDTLFEEFWDLYDYKKSRDKAEKAWKTLNQQEKALALQHAPVYAQSTPDKQFRKHPTTYLNNKSFNDEIIERTISTKLSYAELEWERLKNLG